MKEVYFGLRMAGFPRNEIIFTQRMSQSARKTHISIHLPPTVANARELRKRAGAVADRIPFKAYIVCKFLEAGRRVGLDDLSCGWSPLNQQRARDFLPYA